MVKPSGSIEASIFGYLESQGGEASLDDISRAVTAQMGAASPSVQKYLDLNVGKAFERTGRDRYGLKRNGRDRSAAKLRFDLDPVAIIGKAKLYHFDAFDWLESEPPASFHACVTDPPYGLVEYTDVEQRKLRSGKGGIWRIPPSFDGHKRAPLPRFTVLDADDRIQLHAFFKRLGTLLNPNYA